MLILIDSSGEQSRQTAGTLLLSLLLLSLLLLLLLLLLTLLEQRNAGDDDTLHAAGPTFVEVAPTPNEPFVASDPECAEAENDLPVGSFTEEWDASFICSR